MSAASEQQGAGGAGPIAATAVIEVEDLRIAFDGVHAVDGATFAIPPGEITGLIGPNGAGKSTALKLIAGSLKPTGGSIRYFGEEISGRPAHEVARLGLLRTFQLSSEFPRLTVIENLLVAAPGQRATNFAGALRGKRYWRGQQSELVDRARILLEEFQMTHATDDYAGQLSGGQRRLVEIMRALMAEPKVLLLDEPLAGVNPTLRLVVEEHLLRVRDQGMTMVMVEHELGTVERCCSSVVVMAQGKVLDSGSMAEMRESKEVVDAYLVG